MKTFKDLLSEYKEQYPNEENPLTWHAVTRPEEVYDMLLRRNGRKIKLKTDPEKLDGGQLYYD
tara:strand:- start:2832 stop:3020 length:189 start_codon:yes stop_codon:yes gene_type:complete